MTIFLKHDLDLTITIYNSFKSNTTNNVLNLKWSELMNRLTTPEIKQDKLQGKGAIYGMMKDDVNQETGEIMPNKRSAKNVVNRSCIVLDYDDIESEQEFKAILTNKLAPFSYFAHTTHSHGLKGVRYRVVIPIEKPIDPNDFDMYTSGLAGYIGLKLDQKSKVAVQLMALPCIANKNNGFEYFYNDAPILDYKNLNIYVSEYADHLNHAKKVKVKKQGKTLTDDYIRKIMLGVPEGSIDNTLAQILGHLTNSNINYQFVWAYAVMWGERCEPPMNIKDIKRVYKSIMRYKGGINNSAKPSGELCSLCKVGKNDKAELLELIETKQNIEDLQLANERIRELENVIETQMKT